MNDVWEVFEEEEEEEIVDVNESTTFESVDEGWARDTDDDDVCVGVDNDANVDVVGVSTFVGVVVVVVVVVIVVVVVGAAVVVTGVNSIKAPNAVVDCSCSSNRSIVTCIVLIS